MKYLQLVDLQVKVLMDFVHVCSGVSYIIVVNVVIRKHEFYRQVVTNLLIRDH